MTRYQYNIQLYLKTGDLGRDMRWYVRRLSLGKMIESLHKESYTKSIRAYLSSHSSSVKLFRDGSPNTIIKRYIEILNKQYEPTH